MRKGDGGPIHPAYAKCASYPHNLHPIGGMSLRDYFAAAALTGLLTGGGAMTWQSTAEDAYRSADAMLAAREEK